MSTSAKVGLDEAVDKVSKLARRVLLNLHTPCVQTP